ncbi:MAG: phosphoserine phosphatase RsbU/P [Thermoanaerobaculia bacterium]|jgi:serine phosphatase RsbU (regulator of sigma subunit)|nr:phosphoserine phosphatase RsbU/P [Thermoanaerobaculia bacterium]
MLPVQQRPEPPKSRRGAALFLLWLGGIGVIAVDEAITRLVLRPLNLPGTALFRFITFLACLLVIALTLYAFAVFVRWTLRKLFWRVGRRLFLSYVLIGVLPFFLFGILLLTIGYMICGVMTHAALRGERQASLGQLESAAFEYSLTGKAPTNVTKSLEIYDTDNASGAKLPAWLKSTTFSGMVWRDKKAFLVASRQAAKEEGAALRTIVFAEPLDAEWIEQFQDKSGMTIRTKMGERTVHEGRGIRVGKPERSINIEGDDDGQFTDLLIHSLGRKVVWPDVTELTDWDSGSTNQGKHELVTLIANPFQNLFHFYFGAEADSYVSNLFGFTVGITFLLLIFYVLAVLFAAVLIFSITRAVNRIEKGTKAVERGDFTYRIAMKPRNQLGEMAQSFDRMTESIATLLVNVAENERLQSEIEIAASIQRNLLPKEGPQFRGVSFSAHFEPTASIGGDYYDVFNIDKTRLAVAIGDVSGHGLSTGLVMAMVKAAITTLVEEGAEETSLFHRLNDLVFRSTERRAFMTLAFTIFDLEHGTIRHTNAGHLYPYLLREGQRPRGIEVPSLPLGVRSTISTHTAEVDLQEGDAVVYLSDGIVEAQDENGEPFGFDQLEALLAESTDRSPSTIRDRILAAVARHCGTRPADDDRTVMILRFDNFTPAKPAILIAEGASANTEEPQTAGALVPSVVTSSQLGG